MSKNKHPASRYERLKNKAKYDEKKRLQGGKPSEVKRRAYQEALKDQETKHELAQHLDGHLGHSPGS